MSSSPWCATARTRSSTARARDQPSPAATSRQSSRRGGRDKLLNEKMAGFTDKALKFSMDADASLYEFDDKDEKEASDEIDMKAVISAWIDPPKRGARRTTSPTTTRRHGAGTRPSRRLVRASSSCRTCPTFSFTTCPALPPCITRTSRASSLTGSARTRRSFRTTVPQELPPEKSTDPQPLSDAERTEYESLLNGGFVWNRSRHATARARSLVADPDDMAASWGGSRRRFARTTTSSGSDTEVSGIAHPRQYRAR